MFLLLGIALVVLAFAAFPTRVSIQAQPGDEDYYTVGWLFAPIIGVWGLASVTLGLVQSSMPRRSIEPYLLFILAVVCIGLSFAAYTAVVFGSGIIYSVGRGEPFFWLYFGLVLAPSLITISSTVKFLKAKEKTSTLMSNKVRAAAFVLLAAVPLTYWIGFATYLNLH